MILEYEMQWTVRYFLKEAEKWKSRSRILGISAGKAAYAARQAASWTTRAATADRDFKLANTKYVTLM